MDIQNEKNKLEKSKIEDYKKHPMINLADSINRSTIGDLNQLTKGSYLARILTMLIIIGAISCLLFFEYFK
ncbi:MAG TPA: hypothetical protein GXX21_03800 [Syntrophomonadaceae bacterium]|nr:hypothetical protein [Syntrophomonadaceae bacterium]HHW28669.1 hypothetical protein [Syntrophomonadaceae bacterium]